LPVQLAFDTCRRAARRRAETAAAAGAAAVNRGTGTPPTGRCSIWVERADVVFTDTAAENTMPTAAICWPKHNKKSFQYNLQNEVQL